MAADGILQTAAPVRTGAPFEVSKRALDLALGSAILIATLPLMLVIALVVRATHRGPAVFWQQRVGKNGLCFWLPKFRSMHAGAEENRESLRPYADHPGSVTFKMRADPRVTAVGRVLRKTSLDEFPQLWSVLRGDMSLVGPRPPLPEEVAQYGVEARRRLSVLPGLTCLWQVQGRSLLDFDTQLALDLAYIERRSLRLDLAILLRTIPAVLSMRGAH